MIRYLLPFLLIVPSNLLADETITVSASQIRVITTADPNGLDNATYQALPYQAFDSATPVETRRVLVRFENFLSSTIIPIGSKTTNATMNFSGVSAQGGSFFINRPLADWNSSSTWNTSGSGNWNSAFNAAVNSGQSAVSVTNLVNRWTQYNESYYGVVMMTQSLGAKGNKWNSVTLTITFREIGDSNNDGVFNQLDLIQVLQAGKYNTGQPASFAEGDWNYDGVFNQFDIIAVNQAGNYQP